MALLRRGHKDKLHAMDEAEAYERCHGVRGDDVRIVKVEPRRPRYDFGPSGERLREAFEKKLDTREPEENAETAAEEDAEIPTADS